MIRKVGQKWFVLDAKGKRTLGVHETKEEAEKQTTDLRLINLRKKGKLKMKRR